MNWYRHGSTDGHQPPTLADRFWPRVEQGGPDGCWPWKGPQDDRGYGRLGAKRGENLKAHRVAWELTNGPIPDGLWVLHRCDNPPCCNPAHLFLGTHDANMADCVAKGRQSKGEVNGQAKLTWEAVAEIRRQAAAGTRYPILAARYDVSESAIGLVVRGQRWRPE